MMPYDITPTNDLIFKRIFGNEKGKVSLISLLNAILKDNLIVKDVKFLSTEVPKDEIYSKASRLDVEVTTDNGTIVNVEIQCVDTGDLDSRAIVYASQLVSQHTKRGTSYDNPKVISIWIVRDQIKHGPMANRMCPIEEELVCLTPNLFDEGYEKSIDKMKIIFIQLYKFKDNKLLREKKLMEKIGKMMRDWVQFFLDPSKVSNKDEGMKEAQYIWMKVSGDDEVKARIRAIEKYEMDKGSELATARKQGLIEGEKKGIEKGKKQGLIEGKKEGLIEGKKEGLIEGEKKGMEKGLIEGEKKKMKELALNMKKQGLDDIFIAKCLNVSVEKLNELFD